jgi:LysR family transcriptional regulator, low CO2-responsive transcriptional regulator
MLAFAEFAEDGNFTRAAARLHLSQPALHTKISKLAHSFEGPLYVRRGRQIEITELGKRVQRFARGLIASAAEFESEIAGAAAGAPVVLAAGEGAYLYILGAGIRAYRGLAHGAIRLQTADGIGAVDAVLSGRAHLGVASLETIPAGLHAQPLTRVGQVLAMPSRHPLAKRRAIRLRDLAGVQLIVPPDGRPQRTVISQMLQSAKVPWEVAVEASGWELMLHFVRLGIGLSIVNDCCRLPQGLVARPLPEMPQITYHVFHLARGLSKPAASLKRVLLDHADGWKM